MEKNNIDQEGPIKELSFYKGKRHLTFHKIRHIFRDEKNDILLSVTGATGVIDKSGALMGWVAKMMALYLVENWDIKKIKNEAQKLQIIERAKKEYRVVKKEAADIGKDIHEWISDWIKGKKPKMPKNEKVVNGITAFLKYQKENNIQWIDSERYVFSEKYNYAGILDGTGKIGKSFVLVDFKSSNRNQKAEDGLYSEMKIQVAGYQIAYEEETGKKFDKRMIIRFGKDTGEFEATELGEDDKDKKAFLACLQLKRRLKEIERQ